VTNEPDFRDLVGEEGTREELDRLRRVHQLLVAAGPPPELSPALARPPEVEKSNVLEFKRRRPATVLAIAAAVAAAAFVIGYAVAGRQSGFEQARQLSMHGVGQLAAARARIQIGTHDTGGNYPLRMTVHGLPRLPNGGWYELLLSKHGRPTLSCGSFAVAGESETIRLSVPFELGEFGKLYDGWVVVKHVPRQHAVPIVMTTATRI
jgi:hypothetical protein